ncbi:hypothetical protein [Polaribacter cellanae]|uniref:Uncharacterized protein n=1 Tax=Polaribacter cellanae TaxID=2818493 RepID=A0A975CQF0_9FLAO|nr:hypothetical protein [Polaribacter cellanae]QTE21311.1 hypothetical protein J3359_10770 [Polaribacter cellanae]
MNKKNYTKGEPPNLEGLSFIIKGEKKISQCEFKKLKLVDFTRLVKNKTLEYKKGNETVIELNNFKNLNLIIKNKGKYILYKVIREFYEK